MDGATGAGAAGPGRARRTKYQTSPGAAARTPTPASASAMRPRPEEGAPAVRSMRPSLTSKTQAKPTTMGKPMPSATTT